MDDNEMTIRETTQPMISGHWVGVSNIWERDLPDTNGAIASRLSATLTIRDAEAQRTRVEKVIAGSVVALGADRYWVVDVELGESKSGKPESGTIRLRKEE